MPSESSTAPDTRWWYWIAAVPVVYVLSIVVGFPFALVAMFGLDSAFAVFVFVALFMVLPGIITSIVLPYALYRDIESLPSDNGWHPDRDLYVLLGLVGIFVAGVSPVVSLYYLYKRHEHLGVP